MTINQFLSLKKLSIVLIWFLIFGTMVNAQNGDDATAPPHYVFSQFAKGVVKLKDGRVEKSMLNYNRLTEEIIFVLNGQNLALTMLETIDTVTINNRIFIPFGKVFYEQILNAKISLFIQHKCRLQQVGSEVGYGGTSQVSSTTKISSMSSSGMIYNLKLPDDCSIEDDTHNWIRKDNSMYIADSERDVKKIFPDKAIEIKAFFKTNKLKLKNKVDAIKLVEFLNELK